MENEVLGVVDKRTKATYDVPLSKGAVRAMDSFGFIMKRAT
jgi:hypothetical protein